MADTTKIEWCDSTFNPWVGCTKIAPACDHCYAEGWAKRSGMVEWGNHPRRRTSAALWHEPMKWQHGATAFFEKHGRRRRVFCASLADVFDNQVPTEWRDDLWQLIYDTPGLDWLLLTKRPQNIEGMLPASGFWNVCKRHVWLGTTVEDQEHARRNIHHIVRHACAVHFVSIEPMLGAIDLTRLDLGGGVEVDTLRGRRVDYFAEGGHHEQPWGKIDWVIAGGESGHHARPSHPDWFTSLRDQCAAAGVPFLFKQWGEWRTAIDRDRDDPDWRADYGHRLADRPPYRWMNLAGGQGFHGDRFHVMENVGKAAAGRELDGLVHDGFPAGGPP